MTRPAWRWLALALLSAPAAHAQATPSNAGVPDVRVAQAVRRTIQIGGDLTQWDGLPQYPVVLSNGVPSVPVTHRGYYSVAFDDQNLYLLGVFDQAKDTVLAKLDAAAPEWWNDDAMELFVRPDAFAAKPTDLHFAVNPAGTRFKAYTATTDYQSVGRIEDQRWVLELALPLNTATLPAVKAGDVWSLKVGREHQKAAEFPIWPIGGDFNSPGNYGYLAFTDAVQEPAALAQGITARLGTVATAAPLHSRLSDIGSYAVYYGRAAADVEKLSHYDLAIVQPGTLDAAQLRALHENGTRAVAYLTIGELDPKDPDAARVDPAWVLGKNANWGSSFMDASQPGWRALVEERADALLKAGYDGLFLDTLDTADAYPKTAGGLVQIVQDLRARHPDAVLVQNRGFSLLNQTAPSIDAVMFESFSSTYDFKTRRYGAVDGDPSFVQAVSDRGLKVLALDYALPTQTDLISRTYQRARSFGFVPFVSTINLDQLNEANP